MTFGSVCRLGAGDAFPALAKCLCPPGFCAGRLGVGVRRFVVMILVGSMLLATASQAADEVRLVEYAGLAAAFRANGQLKVVKIGDRVPGTRAVLRHINRAGVSVEFAADSHTPLALQQLERGDAVRAPVADKFRPMVRQDLQIDVVSTIGPAAAADSRDGEQEP